MNYSRKKVFLEVFKLAISHVIFLMIYISAYGRSFSKAEKASTPIEPTFRIDVALTCVCGLAIVDRRRQAQKSF